jgi:hypothetical protein
LHWEIEQVSADDAYDWRKCYGTLNWRGAKIWRVANTKAGSHACDENLRRTRRVGRKQCKRESGYHHRSLAGIPVFQLKTIFGDRLQTWHVSNQFKELLLKSVTLII